MSEHDGEARLRAERDEAIQAARSALADITRLTRVLTALGEPGPIDHVLDRTTATLSELFAADVVALLIPTAVGSCTILASTGFPEDMLQEPLSCPLGTPLASALQDAIPVVSHAMNVDPVADHRFRELEVDTVAWIPTRDSLGAVSGVLILGSCLPEMFSTADLDLLVSMSHRIGLAVEQAQRGRQLEHLARSSQAIARHLEEQSILREAAAMVPEVLRAQAASIFLIDSQARVGDSAHYHLTAEEEIWTSRKMAGMSASLLLSGEVYQTSHVGEDGFAGADDAGQSGRIRSTLVVPLVWDGNTRGALCAYRFTPHEYGPDTVAFATLYAGQVAAALENARLFQTVSRLAFHDPLSDLPNRGRFMQRLTLALTTPPTSETSLVAVLFIDLDSFKWINDNLGHAAGDGVLAEVASRIRACVRAQDTPARLGGDEFTVLVEGITEPGPAIVIADRIRKSLLAPIHLPDEEVLVTASIGIAVGRPTIDQPDDLVRKADQAMYAAKNSASSRYGTSGAQVEPEALGQVTGSAPLLRAAS